MGTIWTSAAFESHHGVNHQAIARETARKFSVAKLKVSLLSSRSVLYKA